MGIRFYPATLHSPMQSRDTPQDVPQPLVGIVHANVPNRFTEHGGNGGVFNETQVIHRQEMPQIVAHRHVSTVLGTHSAPFPCSPYRACP